MPEKKGKYSFPAKISQKPRKKKDFDGLNARAAAYDKKATKRKGE